MATNKDFIVKNGLSVGEDISVSGSVTSNLQFDDSVQLQLGTDSDLLIYHDNSNAYIDDVGTGSLYIRSGTTYFQNAAGTKTSIQTNSGAGRSINPLSPKPAKARPARSSRPYWRWPTVSS